MSDDLNTEIKIGADASGVEAGVGKAKRSLKDLGDAANKAGKDAGEGVKKVGDNSEKAAKAVERSAKSMQSQLQRVIASFEGGEKGSRQFYESLARQRNIDVSALKPLLDQLDAVKAKSAAAAQAANQVGGAFSGLSAVAGIAGRAIAAIGIGVSVGELVKMADASTNVASRLGLVTSSAAQLVSVQQQLFEVAQSSRVSFADLVGTYAQVARSTKELGVSQTSLLGVVKTISQAVTISGGSAASAQAALVQLSQGFAAGALRGEELNSVMEQTPRLAQAIAEGLGVSIGKLREMGQAGELTAEKVLGALEKSAGAVAAEFGKMAVTVESASTVAANSALKLVGVLDKITGASAATASGILRLSAGMDSLTLNVERLGSAKGLSDFLFLAFNNERSLNGELEITQKELANLEARLAKAPSNIYTRSAVAEMREYVKELKEAQARLAALSGQSGPAGAGGGRGSVNPPTVEQEAKRQAQLVEDGNKFRLKQSGIPESYVKDMNELIRLNQAGVIVGKEYTDALKKQQEVLLQKSGVTKGLAAAVNEEQNAYESLISSIRAKVDEDKLELEGGQNLTESQRMRIKLDQDLQSGRLKLNGAHEASVRAAIAEKEVTEKSLKVYKDAMKLAQERQNLRNKETDGIEAWTKAQEAAAEQSLKSISERVDSLEKEEEATELAAAMNISLAEAIERVAIARLREKRDGPTGAYKDSPVFRELTEEIELRERLANDIGKRDTRERNEDFTRRATEKAQQEMDRYIEDTSRGLGDAIEVAITDGSKAGGEKMREVLQEALLRKPLRMLIDGVMNQVTGGALQLLGVGGGGGGGAAGGASNLVSMASNAYSLYNGASSLYTVGSQYLAGTMSAANAGGTIYANAVGGGLDALLATNGAYGTAAGGASGAASGAAAGSWGAGGIAALIALAVINAVGGMRSERMIGSGLAGTLGGSSSLTPWEEWREGGTLIDGPDFTTGNPLEVLAEQRRRLQVERDEGRGETNYAVSLQATVTSLEKSTAGLATQTEVFNREIGKGYKAYRDNVVQMADSLGLGGDAIKDFAYTLGAQDLNFQGLKPEEIQAKIAETFGKAGDKMAEQLLGSWKEVTDTVVNTYATEQMTQANDGTFVTETTVTKRMEYQASVYAKAGETAIQTLERLSTSFNTLNEASDALGFGIQQGSLALADFADDFIEAFGGLERFTSTTSAYMQAYYSDEERRQALLRSGARQAQRAGLDGVTAESLEQLGQAGIKAFVDGLVEGGASAGEIADAMDLAVYLAPAFASVEAQTPVVQELSNVVDELTQSYQNAIKSLTGDRDSLAVEVLRAQGDEEGAKALERTQYLAQFAGLDEARRKEIETLYDGNMATRAYIEGIKAAAQAQLDALAKLRADSLALIDGAAGKTDAALAAYERAADKERERLQGVIDSVRSVFQAAEEGAKSFFSEVEAVARFQGAEGRDFISQALASAQAGGALPDGKELSDAIAAVGKDFSASQFTSQAEADFQRLVVANELKGLQDISGDQLTEAEKQLEALNEQVEFARDQVNLLRGIDSSLKDLPTAIANLIAAYNEESRTRANVGAKAIIGTGSAVFDKSSGAGLTSSGAYFDASDIAEVARDVIAANGSAGKASVLDALEGQGYTMPQYNEMFGLPPGTLEAEAKALGRPIYHSGTTYVPETGFALLQQGEAVIPAAFNPFNGGSMGNTARMEVLIEALIERVESLEAAVETGNGYAGTTAGVLKGAQNGSALNTTPVSF